MLRKRSTSGLQQTTPTIKTETYAKRWGIETGYGKIEECRTKTRISDMETRMLCFYYSLVLYNEWIIVRAMISDGTERQSVMTMLTFKVQLEINSHTPVQTAHLISDLGYISLSWPSDNTFKTKQKNQ